MRRALLIILICLGCLTAGVKAWAVVSAAANISKENGYAILTPPAGDSVIAKENAYVILTPPVAATISKLNAYAVVMRNRPPVQIMQ